MTATVLARPSPDVEAPVKAAPTVGLCLYANAKEPAEGGWACVDGGTPFSIEKPADLPSNVLWVTSADYTEFRVQGHRSVHNLRQPTYFRTDLKQMATDLGLEIDGANAAQSIVPLSQVVARVARIAHGAYKWRTATFSEDNLADSIKASMPPDIPPARHMLAALNAAFQKNSKSLYSRYLQDSFSMTLRTNRLQHAQTVLRTPIPDDAWEEIAGHSLPAGNTERLQFVLSSDRPVLAEVTVDVSNTDSNEANLTAFGSQMGNRMPLRRWMAHPELIWMSQFARITIHSAFISASYRPLSESMRLPDALVNDPYLAMSYSAGIVAENHLQALSNNYWNPMTKQFEVTARGVWLRAVDRAESFLLARRVLAAGFDIFGYTMGSVTAKVRRVDLMQFGEFVLKEGLITPPLDLIMKHHGDEDDHLRN